MSNKPVVFDLEENDPLPDVAAAQAVPELTSEPQTAALQQAAKMVAGKPSRLSRWFWSVIAALVGAVISVAAWDFASDLILRIPVLGWAVTVALAVALGLALFMGVRELAALARLRRVDGLRRGAEKAQGDLALANAYATRIDRFYSHREELSWGRARLAERRQDLMDADAVLHLTEAELLVPLDALALREVEAAARQVAMVTALVPLALADVVTALVSSMRMIRRVAEIYGGRGGFFSSWRLTRAVLSHLVATGAVAVGDDLLEPVLGGSVLSKLSRRFGEGLVNGALTARVGIAAMDVCRPMPFSQERKPKVRAVVKRALTGLFSKASQ
ncbi:YcjF family protein [Parasedimentitalea huanghaiensis]|uniref:TIGR01620 family protein n=1 Tax=Parasedimentitalea huanghaiensis TaxID=2682100 RepID=A0A6L6WHG4_9RHOB|nr:TIGR01620 family protein [Zongyanglinia huanghaiensis]MVO16015.1 TIGR01620 family protein [Zongyanglinia huanghaiensis]